MSKTIIQRVDDLPLILNWLLKMHLHVIIDSIWSPHRNWNGLTYGQLAVLFVTFIIHQRSHVLSKMEDWVADHHIILQQVTGWEISLKEATDDRLGILLESLGSDCEQAAEFQQKMGQNLIQAFDLPTKVARYDTTSFSVHHSPEKDHELLRFGYSKDKRPDLLQFKQGLGTLDPAGIPILTQTLSGETADDGLYVPSWRQMAKTIGHKNFLFVADCKAAALDTRATIAKEKGTYLFPLPMSGKVPEWLREQVTSGKNTPQEITMPGVLDENEKPKVLGQGFIIKRKIEKEQEDEPNLVWEEQWFVTQSFAHAARQKANLKKRLERTIDKVKRMLPKKEENQEEFSQRVFKKISEKGLTKIINVTVTESIITTKRYLKRGRPTPNTPYELEEKRKIELHLEVDEEALEKAYQMAGWRVYVSNQSMTLNQATAYYRNEWLVEKGFHRYKNGSLPVLPLWLRIPKRIKGLMLLLLVALQAITLLEFVVQRSLAEEKEKLAGLVPGNPARKTARPSAEKILDAFDQLNLITKVEGHQKSGKLNEELTSLQKRLLALLGLSEKIYDLTFSLPPP